jgi:hypothetical protein
MRNKTLSIAGGSPPAGVVVWGHGHVSPLPAVGDGLFDQEIDRPEAQTKTAEEEAFP